MKSVLSQYGAGDGGGDEGGNGNDRMEIVLMVELQVGPRLCDLLL